MSVHFERNPKLETTISTLESSGLIRLAQMEPELEYLFRHALVQEATYESILKSDRCLLHRKVAETLEYLYPERLNELAPRLANHYVEAGDDAAAYRYYVLAGDNAAHQYANWEAAMYYKFAIGLTVSHTTTSLSTLYTKRGRALQSGGLFEEARANYMDMETLAHERADPSLELAALIEQATLYVVFSPIFDPAQSLALSDRALGLAWKLGDREGEARILWNQMRAVVQLGGDSQQAIVYGEQSLAITRELSTSNQLAYTLNDLQYAYRANGKWARALDVLVEARSLWQALGNQHMLADNLIQAASIYSYRGEYDLVLALAAEAEQVSQASYNVAQLVLGRVMLAQLYMDVGKPDQALRCLKESWQFGETFNAGLILAVYAATCMAYGAFLPALQLAISVYTAVKTAPIMRLFGPGVTGLLARIYVHWGDLEAAETMIQEARSYLQPGDELRTFQNGEEVCFAEVEIALARHDGFRALQCADRFLLTIREFGANRLLHEMLYLKGQALIMLDRIGEAEAALTEARDEAEAIGARRVLWPILKTLGHLAAQRGLTEEAQSFHTQSQAIIADIAAHCPTDPIWLPDPQAIANPALTNNSNLRTSFLSHAFDRDAVRAGYETMRENFHQLIASLSKMDWGRRGQKSSWTVGELIVHITISLEQVTSAAGFLRRSRSYLSLPSVLFDWANLIFAKTLVHLYTRQTIAKKYDSAYTSAISTLESLQEDEWQAGAICFGERYWTVERLFSNQPLHLAEHTIHIQNILQHP